METTHVRNKQIHKFGVLIYIQIASEFLATGGIRTRDLDRQRVRYPFSYAKR